jgi:hypothetical protein
MKVIFFNEIPLYFSYFLQKYGEFFKFENWKIIASLKTNFLFMWRNNKKLGQKIQKSPPQSYLNPFADFQIKVILCAKDTY